MQRSSTAGRTVSRETRLLLLTILLSVCALWVLGRVRFPERPVTANPVGPILTQLVSPTSFEGLAASVTQLESRLAPLLITVDLAPSAGGDERLARRTAAALRLRGDIAAGLTASRDVAAAQATPDVTVLARDPVSGLTVFRVAPGVDPTLAVWAPRRPQAARYLMAVDVSRDRPSMRPVFVGGLTAATSPVWPGAFWAMPARTDVDPGTLLFTLEGELAGLVVDHENERAIVPGDVLRAAVDRLQQQDVSRTPGSLGLEVQALTPAIAAALGVDTGSGESRMSGGSSGSGRTGGGVVVSWVDPRGPARGRVGVGDLVQGVVDARGMAPLTLSLWAVRMDRLSMGDALTVRVRSSADPQRTEDVRLTAGPLPPPSPGALGLTLRAVRREGAAIVAVAPGSVGDRAGLRPGDTITLAGVHRAPTPAQVISAFAAATADRPLLAAISRGTEHRVLALEPR